MASRTASSRPNHRASLALLAALAGVLAVPVAVVLSRQTGRIHLLDAVWAIPVAAVAAVASLMFERGARGSRLLTTARVLAVTGICFALSSSLAVGIYEFLVWKERH